MQATEAKPKVNKICIASLKRRLYRQNTAGGFMLACSIETENRLLKSDKTNREIWHKTETAGLQKQGKNNRNM